MSLRTEESLNCPCNGIFKCGLHSPVEVVSPLDINGMELLKLNVILDDSIPEGEILIIDS